MAGERATKFFEFTISHAELPISLKCPVYRYGCAGLGSMLNTHFNRCAFMAPGTGHGHLALLWCFILAIEFLPAFASPCRCDLDSVFALTVLSNCPLAPFQVQPGVQETGLCDG